MRRRRAHREEPAILRDFWDLVRDVDLFVGFNVLDFDLKFILQRSIVNRVPPSRSISFRRFQQEPVYDVMREWEGWSTRDSISLDTLSRALGMESPQERRRGRQPGVRLLPGGPPPGDIRLLPAGCARHAGDLQEDDL